MHMASLGIATTLLRYPATHSLFEASHADIRVFYVYSEEDIDAGSNLYMLEDIFLTLGAQTAVNFDGGGSTVAVYKGAWVSKPTCDDTHVLCERAVSSITCLGY